MSTSLIPDLVHSLVEALEANTEALGRLSEGIYYDNDHEFCDFSDEYGDALKSLRIVVDTLGRLSQRIDTVAEIGNRIPVDPRLVRARRALRDIAMNRVDDPAKVAEEGLAGTFRD